MRPHRLVRTPIQAGGEQQEQGRTARHEQKAVEQRARGVGMDHRLQQGDRAIGGRPQQESSGEQPVTPPHQGVSPARSQAHQRSQQTGRSNRCPGDPARCRPEQRPQEMGDQNDAGQDRPAPPCALRHPCPGPSQTIILAIDCKSYSGFVTNIPIIRKSRVQYGPKKRQSVPSLCLKAYFAVPHRPMRCLSQPMS